MKRKKLLSLFLAVVMVVSTVTAMGIQMGATLLPIQSIRAKVELSEYSDEELKEITLGTILDKMEPEYSSGEIVIDPEDTILVVDNDVYSEVSRDTVIDLSESGYNDHTSNSYSRSLTLIIGSGKQLDPDNIRYYIDVNVQKKYTSNVDFIFYIMENGERVDIYTEQDSYPYNYYYTYNGNRYYEKELYSYYMAAPDKTLYVESDTQLIENATGETVDADVDVSFKFSSNKDKNGQILSSFSDYVDVIYKVDGKEAYTDRIYLRYINAGFVVGYNVKNIAYNTGHMYSSNSRNPYQISGSVYLKSDEELNADYYYSITGLTVGNNYQIDTYGTDYINNIKKAVEGYYSSESDASNEEDIKEQLFGDGYKVNLSKTTNFTLFFKWNVDDEDETATAINLQVYGYQYSSSSSTYYNDITIPVPAGYTDPWFRLRSASAEDYTISARAMDNIDTYYSYGYQTMFIYPKKKVTEEETTTSEEETTTTEEETTASETETTTPEAETTTPEAETTTPEEETTTSEAETTTTETETTAPEEETTTTEEETTVSETETTTPEAETTTPEAETTTPEEETTTSEAETTTSETVTSVSEAENETIKIAEEAAKATEENEESLALSKLMLNVYTNGVNIYDSVSGAPVDFKKDPQDFTAGTVQYTVAMEKDNNKTKNYFISVLQPVEGGAKLYVNGPEEREVYFDGYFDNRHDILIANIGDEALTGLNAELVEAQNVKLDGYWNVGGEKNDTLQAFTNASSYNMANLAKIRLVPDGEGEVKGTLKITADGQEPVFINLIGHAGDPKIVTESPLQDAVKYVPYRAIIATNNIHDWNTVTYYYYGKLPKGVTFNEKNGEIYGTPQETGTFEFHVYPRFSSGHFSTSYVDFELTVQDNTNENVFNASDENYEIKTSLGQEATSGAHDYVLGKVEHDQLFVSNGSFNEFIDLWLNGQRLEKDKDYSVEEGSTRIVIFDEVFDGLEGNENNTIAAEFREDGDLNKDLRRTAQNFKIDLSYTEPTDPDNPENPGTVDDSQTGSFTSPDNGGDNQGSGNQGDDNSDTSISGSTDNTGSPENPTSTDNSGGNAGNNDSANQPQENQNGGNNQTSVGSVNIFASVTDANGSTVAGLSVELHSDVKTAATDDEGKFEIYSAEFGSHTLILKNEAQGLYAEKKFDLIKDDAFAVTDNTVTAPDGASVSLNIVLDGTTIRFTNDIDAKPNIDNVNDANEDKAVPTGVAFPACVAAAALSAMGLIILNVRRKR